MIAIITMLIDHIGAGILLYVVKSGCYPFGGTFDASAAVYYWIRHIGRQAFPIYCFLLTEGLMHTRSVPKYARNLLIFGIISEPFFDYALKVKFDPFSSDIVEVFEANKNAFFSGSNVYFTLLIGLLVIWVMRYVEESFGGPLYSISGTNMTKPYMLLLYAMPVVAGALLAKVAGTDYKWWGVVLIAIFFMFRNSRPVACLIGFLFFMNLGTEAWSLPAFLLIAAYNGEQGRISRKFKYAFYAFYPVHLCLIYLTRTCLLTGILPQG